MTETQGKIIREMKQKHNLKENTSAYMLMLLGVGYGMSLEDIEGYMFHSDKESMIEKDMRRICMFLNIPLPEEFLEEKGIEDFLRKTIAEQKKAVKQVERYNSFFEKHGVTFSQIKNAKDVKIVFEQEEREKQKVFEHERDVLKKELQRYQEFFEKQGVAFSEVEQNENIRLEIGIGIESDGHSYGRLLSVIMNEKKFDNRQLELLTKAVKLSIPENEILKFANPNISFMQMEKYIEFWQLQNPTKKKKRFWQGKRKKGVGTYE